MLDLAFFVGVLAFLFCLTDWRYGLLVTVAVGFLADPIRKIMPDQPVAMTIVVGLFLAACLLTMLRERGVTTLRMMGGTYRDLTIPLQFFLLWVLISAARTVLQFGNPVLAGIGTVAYLAPLPGLILGFASGGSRVWLRRFLVVYVVGCSLMTAGILLQVFGVDALVLREVGVGLYISRIGRAYSGFFRTTEVAAWHIGTTIALLIIVATSRWRSTSGWLASVPIALLLAAGILTGRRKMLAQLFFFICLYALMLLHFRKGAKRLVAVGLPVALLVALASTEFFAGQELQRFQTFFDRGSAVVVEAPQRFRNLGLGSVIWSFQRHGFLGSGAGIASQRAQYFGGGVEIAGYSAEGGLGKIISELGVPGLLLGLWLALGSLRAVWRNLIGDIERTHRPSVSLGLLALLGAQIPTFMVAAQIYGDPFVLIVLGLLLGFVLAFPEPGAESDPGEDLRSPPLPATAEKTGRMPNQFRPRRPRRDPRRSARTESQSRLQIFDSPTPIDE